MAYKKFQADQLFTGHTLLAGDHVLITDQKGTVEEIVSVEDAGNDVQRFNGVLSPGLINCHCHLELSHLKNVIPPGTGLIDFLCSVVTRRDADAQTKAQAIIAAEKEMFDNGIVAVGDIGNTDDTGPVKSTSKICWQNFVEVLSFTDENAASNVAHYSEVLHSLETTLKGSKTAHRSSLVPHAAYSISPTTFQQLNDLTQGQVISIHNQEHPAEDELYKSGGGGYLRLFKIFGVDRSPFPITGKSSIRSYLPHFHNGQTIFLVHNTYMPEEDIVFANDYARENGLSLVYCLCPNANLYIESVLPPIERFIKHNCLIVIGTDSYSSNWQLSIAKEMQALEKMVSLQNLLQWATINGAKALQWDDDLGSFEKGKKPGVTLLDVNGWTSKRLA